MICLLVMMMAVLCTVDNSEAVQANRYGKRLEAPKRAD
jgi:hypothetical protein